MLKGGIALTKNYALKENNLDSRSEDFALVFNMEQLRLIDDFLVCISAVVSALCLVSWGSLATKNYFTDFTQTLLTIKSKIGSSSLVFFLLSAVINIGSGVYFSFAFFNGKGLSVVYATVVYLLIANYAVFIVGLLLYLLNIPVRLIHSFVSWTVEHDFEGRWKKVLIVVIVAVATVTVIVN